MAFILEFLTSKTGIILIALLVLGGAIGVEEMRLKWAQADVAKANAGFLQAKAADIQDQASIKLCAASNDRLIEQIKMQNDRIDELEKQSAEDSKRAADVAAAYNKAAAQRRAQIAGDPNHGPTAMNAWQKAEFSQ